MKIYRYLTEKELKSFQCGDLSEIGNFYDRFEYKRVNTHRYKKGVRYLHFYSRKEDIRHAKTLHKNDLSNDYYTCEFDIPALKAHLYHGQGIYDGSGYKIDKDVVSEFAIPVQAIRSEYLTSYELDEYHYDKVHELDFLRKMMKEMQEEM